MKLGGAKRLGEEVRDVIVRAHERHLDLELLDHVANEEVSSLDMLHAIVISGLYETSRALLLSVNSDVGPTSGWGTQPLACLID